MDFIRASYIAPMRLFRDSDRQTMVRWYFAPPGAKLFPGVHRFVSSNWWDRKTPYDKIGDIPGTPRTYYNGAVPPGYTGQDYCGKLDWYQNGVPSDGSASSLVRDGNGVPFCCTGRDGGLFNLGSGTVAFAPGPYAPHGSGGAVANWTAGVHTVRARFAGSGAIADGTAGYGGDIPIVGSGGAVADGQADVLYGSLVVGSGGALGNSTAGYGGNLPVLGSGGALADGAAGVGVPVTPGTDCSSAGTMVLDTTYSATLGTFGSQWWKVAVPNGTTRHVTYTVTSSGFTGLAEISAGLSCAGASDFAFLSSGQCASFSAVGDGFLMFIKVNSGMDPTSYTLRASSGSCP